MISVDVRIVLYPGAETRKSTLIIESASGTRLVEAYLEDMPPDQLKLLAAVFEGTGRYVGKLMGEG